MTSRANSAGKFHLYLFGSSERSEDFNDIDILCVCERDSDQQTVRAVLSDLSCVYPIDLLMMTSEEETELNFVASERCRLLAEVIGLKSRSHHHS